ncbi:hypothetical protein [Dactylosporangium sp. NPDC051484]|uniref:hypothetical protein n=1 Tax=Dactylosporangium sp. NPDC051484 TaxID=3154942 RepID=UPI00344B85E3
MITIESHDVSVAANMLRSVLRNLPPRTPTDRATARRIQGAVLALDAVVARPTNDRL